MVFLEAFIGGLIGASMGSSGHSTQQAFSGTDRLLFIAEFSAATCVKKIEKEFNIEKEWSSRITTSDDIYHEFGGSTEDIKGTIHKINKQIFVEIEVFGDHGRVSSETNILKIIYATAPTLYSRTIRALEGIKLTGEKK